MLNWATRGYGAEVSNACRYAVQKSNDMCWMGIRDDGKYDKVRLLYQYGNTWSFALYRSMPDGQGGYTDSNWAYCQSSAPGWPKSFVGTAVYAEFGLVELADTTSASYA